MNKEILIKIRQFLLDNNNPMKSLISNERFILSVLNSSSNDINVFCCNMGLVYSYYLISNDKKTYKTFEEIQDKFYELIYNGFDFEDWVMNKGVFTHSCNGNMVKYIRQNGLGCDLNKDKKLYAALNYLENKLGVTGEYTKSQSGRLDEVYFTSPGATSFGYACNFAPERLFLGILRQERNNSIDVTVGESKIDYYRKVIYSKFDNVDEETKSNIEIVLNGYFSSPNCIVSFPISEIINSNNIYFERTDTPIKLQEHLQQNCGVQYYDFFTSNVGSNSNANNMDNFVMINTVIPPSKLSYLFVPDRYDLIQLIAKNKKLNLGDRIDYFTLEPTLKERKK